MVHDLPHPGLLPTRLRRATARFKFIVASKRSEDGRRRRIVRRLHENSCVWIYWTLIRTIKTGQLPFPLLSAFAFGFGAIASKRSEDGGERIKGESERKTQI